MGARLLKLAIEADIPNPDDRKILLLLAKYADDETGICTIRDDDGSLITYSFPKLGGKASDE
jgi:hypothetical protein